MTAHLVEWSIRAGLMAAGTAAVLRLLRIRRPAARHAAWTGVLAVMLFDARMERVGAENGLAGSSRSGAGGA